MNPAQKASPAPTVSTVGFSSASFEGTFTGRLSSTHLRMTRAPSDPSVTMTQLHLNSFDILRMASLVSFSLAIPLASTSLQMKKSIRGRIRSMSAPHSEEN